jgi:hypothetical protein
MAGSNPRFKPGVRGATYWLFGLYLVSRLLMGLWALQDPETRMFNGDSALYEQYALSMLETGEYLAPGYGTADTDPMADMIRPPGYPLLIAAVYSVFGTGFWGKVGLLLLNLAGGVALWWGIMGARGAPVRLSGRAAHALDARDEKRGARDEKKGARDEKRGARDEKKGARDEKKGARGAPLHAALILIFDLGLLLFSKEILTEMVFAPMMVWMVVGMGALAGRTLGRINDAPVTRRPFNAPAEWARAARPYGAGTLLGLATLLKPITFYLPWVMIPVLRYLGWKWSRIAAFVLIAAGIPFLWQARNYVTHGTFAYTSIAAENLMTGHAAIVLSAAEGLTHAAAIDSVRANYARLASPEDDFNAISDKKSAVAKEVLLDHPFIFVTQMAKGVAFTLFDPGREVWVRTFGESDTDTGSLLQTMAKDGLVATAWSLAKAYPFLVLYVIFLGVVYVFAVRGFYRLWHEDRKLFVLLTVLIAYFLVLGGPLGYARFRVYVLPLIVSR